MDGYTYLAPESSRLPLSTSRVPESFPLGGEVSISAVKQEMLELDQTKEKKKGEKAGGTKGKEYSRRDSKQKRIILLQRLGVVNDGILGSLTRCVHLGQDFLRESLGNLVDVDLSACCSDAFGFGLGESGDVAVHGVLFVGDEEVSC